MVVTHDVHSCLFSAPVGKNIIVEPEVIATKDYRRNDVLIILLHRPSCPDVAKQRETASDEW